jgi:hypothetical protein
LENNFTGVLFLGAHFFSLVSNDYCDRSNAFWREGMNARKRSFWFFREKREREREAVFFLRSSSSLVKSLLLLLLSKGNFAKKKNARVCFIKKKKKKKKKSANTAFSSRLFEKNVGRRVLRARNEARFSVAKSSALSSARAFFISSLFFLRLFFLRSKKKCSGKMRHKNRRHHIAA